MFSTLPTSGTSRGKGRKEIVLHNSKSPSMEPALRRGRLCSSQPAWIHGRAVGLISSRHRIQVDTLEYIFTCNGPARMVSDTIRCPNEQQG